jgi:tRNA A-37 threonylcarbamoyl transferase component Bud32
MQHTTVQFGKNTVTKTAAPVLMRVEVEKTRKAAEIGRDCGLFRVPKILDYDENRGIAVFERLDIKPLSKTIGWGEQRRILAGWLGTSLAIIHREMVLPDDMCVPLPDEFVSPHDHVFLHGDLSVDNVCVGRSWPQLAIVDWQMTGLYGGKATYGTRYFDILWFASNIINRPRVRLLFNNPVSPVMRAFMGSYFQEAKIPYTAEEIAEYASKFFGIVMPLVRQRAQRSWGRSRLLLQRSQVLLQQFINSLGSMSEHI